MNPSAFSNPPRDVLQARRGMIAASHPFVAGTGLDVLRKGGNAVDAAVAAAAVLTVVEPYNGHLGGDTFIQISLAGAKRVVAINASGAAPAAATLERYRYLGGIPEYGLPSSTVPGTVSGWALAVERYGTRPLAELLEPAIYYAEHGIPVTSRLARIVEREAPIYRRFPDTARVFLPGGSIPAVGSTLRQPGLAASLRRIAEHGRDDFYRGDLMTEMVRYSETHGGLFNREDFATHTSEEPTPLAVTYRDYTIYEQPPVSQGIIVLLTLNILEQFDLSILEPGSVARTHLLIEALKLAFADRLTYLGDPCYVKLPLDMLLSKEHAREQAARIDLTRARPQVLPAQVQPDTTSLCVADQAGTMVSYIQSLFSGAGVVLGETGVLMNSRLRGFNLTPGHPNCLAPGKRPIHTLNTYVVYRDGEPVLVGGTPGAHWQVQTNVQILVNVLDAGMDVQRAIDAPRFLIGDQLDVGTATVKMETRDGARTIRELRELGHDVTPMGPWEAGGTVQLISRNPANGLYTGGTETRHSSSTILGF
jgi:gamma-glutamyltranspeptidase/glutathione hydrolase